MLEASRTVCRGVGMNWPCRALQGRWTRRSFADGARTAQLGEGDFAVILEDEKRGGRGQNALDRAGRYANLLRR